MRREERVTVQGPVKELQPDGMSHRGLPRGLGHNLLMRFSSLGSSKMEFSETHFPDTLTIQNDQTSYVKHVSAPLYVFFIGAPGGTPVCGPAQGAGHAPSPSPGAGRHQARKASGA